MMTHTDVGAIDITFSEFCAKTGILPDCWIFENMGEHSQFYMFPKESYTDPKERIDRFFFNNGKIVREFKYMKEYRETWMRVFDMTTERPCWTTWSTWKVWD